MEMLNDTFLSTVDRVSRRLGPINNLIGLVVDRIAPKAMARAGCVPIGYQVCNVYCQADIFCCGQFMAQGAKIVKYAPNISTCGSGQEKTCFDGCSAACADACS
jgi:hypothetical protein